MLKQPDLVKVDWLTAEAEKSFKIIGPNGSNFLFYVVSQMTFILN